jgi:hypothetical protein
MSVGAGLTGIRVSAHLARLAREPIAPTSTTRKSSYLATADAHDRDVIFVDVIESGVITLDVDIQHAESAVLEGDTMSGFEVNGHLS